MILILVLLKRDGANDGKAADAIGFIEEECRSRKDPATRCSGEAASATRDGVIAGENNSPSYVDRATRLNNQRQDDGVSVGCLQRIRSAPAAV